MADPAAYVSALQGKPWSVEYTCWILVQDVQRDLFGRELPAFPIAEKLDARDLARAFKGIEAHPERRRWRETSIPSHGAIVLMSRGGGHSTAIHAGVYLDLDGGGILHVDDPHGVVFEELADLSIRNWVATYYAPRERT